MATWIKSTGETIPITFPQTEGESERLKRMQDMVGGYIEAHNLGDQWLFLNEDGLSLGLQTNYILTSLMKGRLSMAEPGIVGNGILFEPGEFEALNGQ